MKRTLEYVAQFTRSKRPRLTPPLLFTRRSPRRKVNTSWVSATHVRNYMLNDPLVDWLGSTTKKSSLSTFKNNPGFLDFIMKRGIEFERELVKYIREHKIPVVTVSDVITDQSVAKTECLMKEGTICIHSAPLRNIKNNTQGIADLIVRSDYLEKLVAECPMSNKEKHIKAPNLGSDNYHYVVIDIKFSTLPLRADGKHLLNSDNFPFYKAQTWIYNQAVGAIQGYTPRYAYILGRRWNYTCKGIKYSSIDCLEKLGVIDFQDIDHDYISKTEEAIAWRREVESHGNEWTSSPPSRNELYPNMCVDSGRWNKEKQQIADENKEITQIWYCGVRERQNAFSLGIKSWDDPRCTSVTLKIGPSRAPVIDAILDINRQNIDKIRPHKIRSKMYDWRNDRNDVFVDFETLLDIFAPLEELPKQKPTNQLFMIGVYYRNGNALVYKNFICNRLSLDEEFRIMNEFFLFMKERGFPKMWFWHAEKSFWTQAENRQYDRTNERVILTEWEKLGLWCDMASLFRTEPIVLKDCFNFSLKNIVKTMNKHGLIPTKLESECDSGTMAAIKAWSAYETSDFDPANNPVLQDVAKYNEFDVKALHDILEYLRREK